MPIKLITPKKYMVLAYYKVPYTADPKVGPIPSPNPTTISI